MGLEKRNKRLRISDWQAPLRGIRQIQTKKTVRSNRLGRSAGAANASTLGVSAVCAARRRWCCLGRSSPVRRRNGAGANPSQGATGSAQTEKRTSEDVLFLEPGLFCLERLSLKRPMNLVLERYPRSTVIGASCSALRIPFERILTRGNGLASGYFARLATAAGAGL